MSVPSTETDTRVGSPESVASTGAHQTGSVQAADQPGASLAARRPAGPVPVPPDGRTSAVVLREVTVRIGVTPVLADLSLAVTAGEIVGLTGPNGAGKSTLLRVLATLLPLSSGHGRVLGADLHHPGERRTVRRRIVLVGHEAAVHPRLTIAENLRLVAELAGVGPARVGEVLTTVGLSGAAARPLADCSRGMVRRVELARVVLVSPDLLLLDEAHAGLDDAAGALVGHLLDELRRRGSTAVVVSHDRPRLAGLVDRVVALEAGRVAT